MIPIDTPTSTAGTSVAVGHRSPGVVLKRRRGSLSQGLAALAWRPASLSNRGLRQGSPVATSVHVGRSRSFGHGEPGRPIVATFPNPNAETAQPVPPENAHENAHHRHG
jgi:hypothetical protein